MTLRPALVCVLLSLTAMGSQAQSVWRCGAEGRQFSDKPCEQGRALETTEPRPAKDVAAAQSAARRERALADQLVKEREQRETQIGKAAVGIHMAKAEDAAAKPKAARKPAKRSAKQRPAEDGIWRATVPSSR